MAATTPGAPSVDSSDAVYVCCSVQKTIQDREGLRTDIIKYSASGLQLWRVQDAGPDGRGAKLQGSGVDANGNPLGAGYTYLNTPEQGLEYGMDLYAVKYAPDGTRLWARNYDYERLQTTFFDVAVLPSGDMVILGRHTPPAIGHQVWHILRVRAQDGEPVWTTQVDPGPLGGTPDSIAVDLLENVFATGSLESTNASQPDSVLTVRLDPQGREVWRRSYSDPKSAAYASYPRSVEVSPEGGVVVLARSARPFAIRYDRDGTLLWVTGEVFGTATYYFAGFDRAGSLYVSGDEAINSMIQFVVWKYSADGRLLATGRYPDPGIFASQTPCQAMAIGSAGTVYLTGKLKGETTDQLATVRFSQQIIDVRSDGTVQLQVVRAPASTNMLEAGADVSAWSPLAEIISDASGIGRYHDTNAPGKPNRLYRVRPTP